MKRTLKATTALLASVNLAVPLPALAQAEADGRQALDRAVEACALDTGSDECRAATDDATSQGVTPEDIEAGIAAEASGEAAPETPAAPAEAEASADTDVEAEATASEPSEAMDAPDESAAPEAPAEPETTAPVEDEPVTEMPADAEPEAPQAQDSPESAVEEELPSEPVVDEEMPSESELQEGLANDAPDASASSAPETETEAETATDAEADAAPPTETSEGDTAGDLPSEDELRQGLSAEAGAGAGADAEAEVDAGAEADAEAEAEATADSEATADEAEAMTDAEMTEGEADATTEGDATSTAAEAPADGSETTGAETEAQGETGATAQTDAEAEALAGTAPVAAAAAEDAQVVESTSDTVTAEEARTSNEDFDSAISRDASQQTQAQAQTDRSEADDDDDDGLSNLEKALLVGAGALAVGAILNNRRVVASSNDRVVVSGQDGGYQLIKDDNALLRQPGAEVQTETFDDGSTRTTISYDDGSQVVTIRDADLRVVRRVRVTPDGQRITLIDDLNQNIQPVDVSQLRQSALQSSTVDLNDEAALRQALAVDRNIDRAYSLSQVRNISEVRQQVPAVDLEAITFDTGSAAIRPEQAEALRELGTYIRETIADNPRAIFLVEGHTDAVGNAAYNLALSDRRAESVALALGEYFDVPTSNLVVQGYGERFLKRQTQDAERANRRASVRNITPLLQVAAAN
ncbi:OmpA family protein [Palleronia marisminoris]|uniref:Putative outer membrane lipoprotein n=1 Tax=Palleronia marisminoris TaxID=315423 RepID=A0A1Y5RCU2_9RHOB|nr:OmpA family protein [Palleronia marisminoris]SFG12980.1 OmpA family protein [Palleronia marisminoris]SLN14323.1 putative outer membrane lipoprotein [Palleronia marisminoris]